VVGGSNPSGRAKKINMLQCWQEADYLVICAHKDDAGAATIPLPQSHLKFSGGSMNNSCLDWKLESLMNDRYIARHDRIASAAY
jgi:hypothetical protein